MAAIRALDLNPELEVAFFEKGDIKYSGSIARGMDALNIVAIPNLTSPELYLEAVKEGCQGVVDEPPSYVMASRSFDLLKKLEGWGVNSLNRDSEGKIKLSLSRYLCVFDKEGKFNPQLDKTPNLYTLKADTVVIAIGQRVEGIHLPEEFFDNKTGRLTGDPMTTQSTNLGNVFVCGDCYLGPSSVVQAMASGREAAISADRFMNGEGLRYERDFYSLNGMVKDYESLQDRVKGEARSEAERLSVIERSLDNETDKTLNPEEARKEAERCLSCGRSFEQNQTCWYCLPCEIECPTQALEVRMPYQVR